MNLRNRVQLIGNVGTTPFIKSFESGKKMASFIMATDDVKKVNGKFVKRTDWHKVITWGKNAEITEANIFKGSEVVINGVLINKTFTDRDGITRKVSEILADSLIYRKIKVSAEKIKEQNEGQRA